MYGIEGKNLGEKFEGNMSEKLGGFSRFEENLKKTFDTLLPVHVASNTHVGSI